MDTHSAPDEDDRCVITWTEEDQGQSDLQFTICCNLVSLFIDLFAAWNANNKVGANLQFRYRQGDAKAQVTPDVYVLPGEPQAARDLSSWATWCNQPG